MKIAWDLVLELVLSRNGLVIKSPKFSVLSPEYELYNHT